MKDLPAILLVLLISACLVVVLTDVDLNRSVFSEVQTVSISDDEFRSMKLGNLADIYDSSQKIGCDPYELITCMMSYSGYNIDDDLINRYDSEVFYEQKNTLIRWYSADFTELCEAYEAVLRDIVYFPVAKSQGSTPFISYENSWMNERTYGGERTHEGTDIMAGQDQRGLYPIISVSDGVIEKAGWLKLGGYRLGIRTESGAFIYYAHLHSYSEEFAEGDTVSAGEVLGLMGDTGYSEIEGTTGNFPVHLHFGIYLNDSEGNEISVNPYYVLQYLEKNTLVYNY